MTHSAFIQSLDAICTEYLAAVPDLKQFAREHAAAILKKHTGLILSPDTVWWHSFDNAMSNPLSYNGREHRGPPKASLTLTDLVIKRFTVRDEVNALDLDEMSGFYTTDAFADHYDQRNQVPMSVVEVLNDFWALDLKSAFKARLATFRQTQADNGRLLFKATFLASAWRASGKNGPLNRNQFKRLVHTLCGRTSLPLSLPHLRQLNQERVYGTVHTFTLGEATASDLLFVRAAGGERVLYAADGWYRSFIDEPAVYNWLRGEAADPESRRRLMGHFIDPGVADEASQERRDSMIRALEQIRDIPWTASQTALNSHSVVVADDVFSWLFKKVVQRLERDVDALWSNKDLRKRLWLVDLSAFCRIATPFAIGSPEAALLVSAATALSLGAHMALALHGIDRQERSQALHGAVIEVFTLLIDGLQLAGHHASVVFAELDAAPLKAGVRIAAGEVAATDNAEIIAFAVDVDLDGLSTGKGYLAGVYEIDADNRYISMQDKRYQVRFIEVIDRWVIVDPNNPSQLQGTWPVELNWRNRWEPYAESGATSGPDGPRPLALDTPTLEANRLARELERYDTSERFGNVVEQLVGRDGASLIKGSLASAFLDACDELLNIRRDLAQQARAVFQDPPVRGRWLINGINDTITPGEFFEHLFSQATSLTVGEARGGVGGKKLLVDNMARLRAAGVRTIYVEGLLKDLHQPALDHFWQTQDMPRALIRRFKQLRSEMHLDAREYYDMERLIKAARRQGIQIQALDCAASVSADGLPVESGLGRRLRLCYAMRRINAHQAIEPDSKWIALLQDSRAGFIPGEPGLAELTNAAKLRVKDVMHGSPTRFSLDAGEMSSEAQVYVKGDVKAEVGTLHNPDNNETMVR